MLLRNATVAVFIRFKSLHDSPEKLRINIPTCPDQDLQIKEVGTVIIAIIY